jgi:hypothetical protein
MRFLPWKEQEESAQTGKMTSVRGKYDEFQGKNV